MAAIDELIAQIDNHDLRERIAEEVEALKKKKEFGLVFDRHTPECTVLRNVAIRKGSKVALKTGQINDFYIVLNIKDGKATCLSKNRSATEIFDLDALVSIAEFGDPVYPFLQPLDAVCNAPESDLWHILIEAENYHALQLLEYLYSGKVDCIYIDPPYNTGARDWKYNNDYVDSSDQYRHSKWLSMMEKRLKIAKKLLNLDNSVLIVTIDEKEYLHLGCLLEELFPEANMQMISDVINRHGVARGAEFSRTNEFIYFLRFGGAVVAKTKINSDKTDVRWPGLRRGGSNCKRADRPNLFYPIYINRSTGRIDSIGDSLPLDVNRLHVADKDGCVTVWPVQDSGEERTWSLSQSSVQKAYDNGYLRIGKYKSAANQKYEIMYLASGTIKGIENGSIQTDGYNPDGTINAFFEEGKFQTPTTQWDITSHEALQYGTNLIKSMLGARFTYPKSIYAEKDVIYHAVANKPDALIVDFFAGSGTTLHAVNLLNAEDGGHRRCIMVTNNEVSEAEASDMIKRGLKPGDYEWEKYGIARYVTWPRTVCSIEGHDVNGQPLKGNYLGSDLPMADGFKANAAFFKLGFLDKNAVALGRQFREMLPMLWMKAGSHGVCPTIGDYVPEMLILPENKFAVLADERAYMAFVDGLDKHPEIETVFIITDSEAGYRSMVAGLNVKDSYQLYRDYLDNFRINAARR